MTLFTFNYISPAREIYLSSRTGLANVFVEIPRYNLRASLFEIHLEKYVSRGEIKLSLSAHVT